MSTNSKTGHRRRRRRRLGLSFVTGTGYGVQIRGRLPHDFRRYLWQPDTEASVLKVRYRTVQALPEVDELWYSSAPGTEKDSRFSLFHHPGGIGLRVDCEGRGLFRIESSQIAIEWLPGGTSAAHYFFSHALPLWLELNGIPVLHASAVSYAGRSLAFLAPSGTGKSTLCDALVRRGATFVSDDGLALTENPQGTWQCSAGPPLIKLWPSAIDRRETPRLDTLARVHERLDKRLLPLPGGNILEWPLDLPELSNVYVLERKPTTGGDIRIEPYGTSESLIRLVEFSLVGAPAAALGWTIHRLGKLARVAERVSVKRLIYPSGHEHWESLRDLVLDDLGKTGSDRDRWQAAPGAGAPASGVGGRS